MQSDRIEYPITTGQIRVISQGNVLPAFWAYPTTGGTFPGVVLIHGLPGPGVFTRRLARLLAQAGHYTIAPELFPGGAPSPGEDVTQNAIVAAAIGALQTHNHCNRSIAVLGLGSGGTLAVHAVVQAEDHLAAAITYHGGVAPYQSLIATLATPILALYGTRDLPLEVADLQAIFGKAPHELVLYQDAGPAFYDDTQPDHDAAASTDAWRRTLDFLGAHLEAPSHAPGLDSAAL